MIRSARLYLAIDSKMNGDREVAAAPAGPPLPLEWKFSQVFGERTAGEEVQEGIILFFAFDLFGSAILRVSVVIRAGFP